MTRIFDPAEILCEFLRSRVSDPRTRATTKTQTFSGDDSETEFELTPTTGNTAQYVSSVSIGGSDQTKWQDYYIDLQNQKVIFVTAPTTGSDNISVTFFEGTTSWIYTDKPAKSIGDIAFPRISISKIGSPGERLGKYDASVEYNIHFQADIWTRKSTANAHIFTISERKYSGEPLAHILGNLVCQALKLYESDLHPIMYDYQPISGPRSLPFDRDYQAFHTVVEFQLKMLNIGEAK